VEGGIPKIAVVPGTGVQESVVDVPCDALMEHVLDLVETGVNVRGAVVPETQLDRGPIGESVRGLRAVLDLLHLLAVAVGVGFGWPRTAEMPGHETVRVRRLWAVSPLR
jgi:hypothetical protein